MIITEKDFLRTLAFSFPAIGERINEEVIADMVNTATSITGIRSQYSYRKTKVIKEFAVIATKDVPAAIFVVTFMKIIRAGTIKNPPPIPSKPVKMPTIVAVIMTAGHLGFV